MAQVSHSNADMQFSATPRQVWIGLQGMEVRSASCLGSELRDALAGLDPEEAAMLRLLRSCLGKKLAD